MERTPIQDEPKNGPWGWTIARLIIGFLIPLPMLFSVLIGLAINNTYFADTFDPTTYLLYETSPYWGVAILIGALVMFLKFRKPQADVRAVQIGGTLLFLMAAWFSFYA